MLKFWIFWGPWVQDCQSNSRISKYVENNGKLVIRCPTAILFIFLFRNLPRMPKHAIFVLDTNRCVYWRNNHKKNIWLSIIQCQGMSWSGWESKSSLVPMTIFLPDGKVDVTDEIRESVNAKDLEFRFSRSHLAGKQTSSSSAKYWKWTTGSQGGLVGTMMLRFRFYIILGFLKHLT